MVGIHQFEPYFGNEEIEELKQVMKSGWLNEHERTREFEKRFAEFVGAKYAVATTSGSVAVFLALKACAIQPGDEVIVPDYTFAGVANAVLMCGAKPVFADVNEFGLITPESISKVRSKKTEAIIPTHINGRIADSIEDNYALIEDCSQAIDSKRGVERVGNFSDIACYSLATTKHLTTGQGGMVTTNDEVLFEEVFRLKDHGRIDRLTGEKVGDVYTHFGFNFKFTELQAALGLVQLKRLPDRLKRMREIWTEYWGGLSYLENHIRFRRVNVDVMDDVTPWQVDAYVSNPEELKEKISIRGIELRRFYKPLHTQPFFKDYGKGEYPGSTELYSKGIFLPSSTSLTNDGVDYVCTAIKQELK